MAAIAVDSTEVRKVSGRDVAGVAVELISKGQAAAYDGSTAKWFIADNNSGTAARKRVDGIAIQASAGADKPVRVQKSGVIYHGGVISIGTIYYLGSTAGEIVPYADLASGNRICIVGVGGPNQYELTLVCKNPGVDKP